MNKYEQARNVSELLRALSLFPNNRELRGAVVTALGLPVTNAAGCAARWAATGALDYARQYDVAPATVLQAAAEAARGARTETNSPELRRAGVEVSVALWRLAVESE